MSQITYSDSVGIATIPKGNKVLLAIGEPGNYEEYLLTKTLARQLAQQLKQAAKLAQ